MASLMICRPHCGRPVTSVGIGSLGVRSIPMIRPHTAFSHRTISMTPWPLSVSHLPRIVGPGPSAAASRKAMASASLRSLPRPRGKRVCLTSMDSTVVSYIAIGHRRRQLLQGRLCLRGVSRLVDRGGRYADVHHGGVGGRLNGGALSGDGRGDQDQGQQEDRVPITQGLGWLVDTSDWQVMTEQYRSPLLPCPVMRCVTE
jgi:hypothetical protein